MGIVFSSCIDLSVTERVIDMVFLWVIKGKRVTLLTLHFYSVKNIPFYLIRMGDLFFLWCYRRKLCSCHLERMDTFYVISTVSQSL